MAKGWDGISVRGTGIASKGESCLSLGPSGKIVAARDNMGDVLLANEESAAHVEIVIPA